MTQRRVFATLVPTTGNTPLLHAVQRALYEINEYELTGQNLGLMFDLMVSRNTIRVNGVPIAELDPAAVLELHESLRSLIGFRWWYEPSVSYHAEPSENPDAPPGHCCDCADRARESADDARFLRDDASGYANQAENWADEARTSADEAMAADRAAETAAANAEDCSHRAHDHGHDAYTSAVSAGEHADNAREYAESALRNSRDAQDILNQIRSIVDDTAA
jgi:hypothetical protein